MVVNKWITGIHLNQYDTDREDGVLLGFDADLGEMYSWRGKLVALPDMLRQANEELNVLIGHQLAIKNVLRQ